MRNAFETNCIAPLFFSKALLPLLQKAADKNTEAPMGVAKAAIIQVTDCGLKATTTIDIIH